MDTSVSALVRAYLAGLVGGKDDRPDMAAAGASEAERRAQGIREVVEQITASGGGLRMADNRSREELYDYSEDLNHGQDYDGGVVVNPFLDERPLTHVAIATSPVRRVHWDRRYSMTVRKPHPRARFATD